MKTILKLAAALVLLVMIGGVVTLQSAIKDARVEQQELAKPGAESGAPADSQDSSRPAGANDEVLRLREANKDLLKLRNEVRQLRRQAEEMAKLSADNERLKNAPKPTPRQYPPDFIRRAALVDAGSATPEAAAQTVMWAMTHGEFKRFKDCLTPEAAAKMGVQNEESLRRDMAENKNVIPGFRVLEKQEVSPDEVVLKIEMMPGLDADQRMRFKRVGNEWKMEGY